MREIIITEREAGQRLDHLLEKKLKNAQKSFIYKMLRKKNITLNGKKALGTERVSCADSIRIYFSEETWLKFTGEADFTGEPEHSESAGKEVNREETIRRQYPFRKLDILYEDAHVVLINKPAGLLSQKAREEDISLCEYLIGYMLRSGQIRPEDLTLVKPSVCNRLDRNTSGIVLCGKSAAGLKELSELIRTREIEKYYHCIVRGCLDRPSVLSGYLTKDTRSNEVSVSRKPVQGAKEIKTEYVPVRKISVTDPSTGNRTDCTLLKVHLITGRSHQIRSHLSSVGHPIIGDYKYGDAVCNAFFLRRFGVRSQMLHCSEIQFPELEGALSGLSNRQITAPLPGLFRDLMGEE